MTFDIPGTILSIFSMTMLDTFDIDSDSVMLTVIKAIKDHKSLSGPDRPLLRNASVKRSTYSSITL